MKSMNGFSEAKAGWCTTEHEVTLDNVPFLIGLYLTCILGDCRTRFLRTLTWRGWGKKAKTTMSKSQWARNVIKVVLDAYIYNLIPLKLLDCSDSTSYSLLSRFLPAINEDGVWSVNDHEHLWRQPRQHVRLMRKNGLASFLASWERSFFTSATEKKNGH